MNTRSAIPFSLKQKLRKSRRRWPTASYLRRLISTLWATDYRCLNDSSEFTIIKPYLKRQLLNLVATDLSIRSTVSEKNRKRIAVRGDSSVVADQIADKTIALLFSVSIHSQIGMSPPEKCSYVCSFCSHSGDSEYERVSPSS